MPDINSLVQLQYGPKSLPPAGTTPKSAKEAELTRLLESNSDAAIVNFSGSPSLREREKHIDDYQKGKGYLSAETGTKIRTLHRENTDSLLDTSPKHSRMYLAYSTALDYREKTRFVHGVKTWQTS